MRHEGCGTHEVDISGFDRALHAAGTPALRASATKIQFMARFPSVVGAFKGVPQTLSFLKQFDVCQLGQFLERVTVWSEDLHGKHDLFASLDQPIALGVVSASTGREDQPEAFFWRQRRVALA
jgi:hypothetical protein